MAGLGWTASANPGVLTPGSPTGSTEADCWQGSRQQAEQGQPGGGGGQQDEAPWGVPGLRSPTEAGSTTCYLCEPEQVSSSPLASTSCSVAWG